MLLALSWWTLSATSARADDEVMQGFLNSFDIPISDLLVKKHDSEVRNLFSGLSVGLAYTMPATRVQRELGLVRDGGRQLASPTLSVNFKYTIVGSWFIGGAVPFYQNPDRQQPWNPDFTYCFGYSDWRPYTISLTYCNYGGNRFKPGEGRKATRFDQGGWSLGYKFPLPKRWQQALLFDQSGSIGCNTGFSYVKNFTDAVTNEERLHKKKLSFGCKYTIWGWWYLNFAVNYYPDKSQKQPWDPDYTYGFGYFDWHPGKISVQYNNYSGNRFDGKPAEGTGKFSNGSFSVSWSMSF
ncbi:MAG: hypothetical protein AAF515_16375 [Pseudomonadota bacterium]